MNEALIAVWAMGENLQDISSHFRFLWMYNIIKIGGRVSNRLKTQSSTDERTLKTRVMGFSRECSTQTAGENAFPGPKRWKGSHTRTHIDRIFTFHWQKGTIAPDGIGSLKNIPIVPY